MATRQTRPRFGVRFCAKTRGAAASHGQQRNGSRTPPACTFGEVQVAELGNVLGTGSQEPFRCALQSASLAGDTWEYWPRVRAMADDGLPNCESRERSHTTSHQSFFLETVSRAVGTNRAPRWDVMRHVADEKPGLCPAVPGNIRGCNPTPVAAAGTRRTGAAAGDVLRHVPGPMAQVDEWNILSRLPRPGGLTVAVPTKSPQPKPTSRPAAHVGPRSADGDAQRRAIDAPDVRLPAPKWTHGISSPTHQPPAPALGETVPAQTDRASWRGGGCERDEADVLRFVLHRRRCQGRAPQPDLIQEPASLVSLPPVRSHSLPFPRELVPAVGSTPGLRASLRVQLWRPRCAEKFRQVELQLPAPRRNNSIPLRLARDRHHPHRPIPAAPHTLRTAAWFLSALNTCIAVRTRRVKSPCAFLSHRLAMASADKGENGAPVAAKATMSLPLRTNSDPSAPPPGNALTGKQEHYLKRELMSQQVKWEINELNSPTALQRFGAPFRSERGEVSPQESELPILRYIFVHHVRDFPFLDKAREKEFWQDKLQVFLESFAGKQISSSEDRLEETKRRKLAIKAQKLVELMMVSGIPTSSGFEERIRFSELEIVDSNAIDTGVLHTIPEGNYINGWDVNVAGVRVTSVKRNIRYHKHAEFLLRIKRKGELEHFVGRRYGDFAKLSKNLKTELPGRVLPQLPKKNKSSSTASGVFSAFSNGDDSDASSISSLSTRFTGAVQDSTEGSSSLLSPSGEYPRASQAPSPRPDQFGPEPPPPISREPRQPRHRARNPCGQRGGKRLCNAYHEVQVLTWAQTVILWRENQRISLRAWIRSLLHNPQVANTKAMMEFLSGNPITPTDEDVDDIVRRKAIDEKRIEEQKKFYEIARKRAAELDEYMEQFRRDIVESHGLTMLFKEIKEKQTIDDLSIQYRKFAEWLRIEIAAVIYHLFLAEDNSPEMFAQARRIHSLIPYSVIKNVIRIANPAAVMSGILDIFLAQPFGARSLMQRIFSLTLNDGIKSFQRSIDTLTTKIGDPVFTEKIQKYTNAEEEIKMAIREEAESEDIDIIVAILRSDLLEPDLTGEQIQRLFNAYVAFNNAVENIDEELKQGAQLFSYLKQLLKLCTRQRDKAMMLNLIEEPVTLQLFRDLFTIFYEPLVRVYKSANVYSSVTDFAVFIDDMIQVVDKCREQDASADPNQTVQAFIDLCQRHEHNFYKFVHEVHTHDNGLFTQLMGWIEGILEFLRKGPNNGKLNVNALFEGGASAGIVDKEKAIEEINSLIAWQEARKKWHNDKTRQKMAAEGQPGGPLGGLGMNFNSSDFGLDGQDLQDMAYDDGSESEDEAEEDDELDPIEAERRRRAKQQDRLRRSAGEPAKPPVSEVHKLTDNFLVMLRDVLAD
ncbi:hypothetical protein ACCO45_001250 [Purpureocillium lilacinum]|uniref:Uncharacterized protein n=1 Tax=Purpureocillium lilacinum TaxID=33203 RepID=A0ACC4E6G9_PURLI